MRDERERTGRAGAARCGKVNDEDDFRVPVRLSIRYTLSLFIG